MRRLLLLAPALALVPALACGGSSSETPWPVEPEAIHAPPDNAVPPSITADAGGAPAPASAKPKEP